MQSDAPRFKKYALQFGLIAGLIGITFQFMLFFQGLHYEQSTTIQVIGISILFVTVAFGIHQYKKDNNGFLQIAQALRLGTGIAVISGIVGLLYYFLLSNDILEAGYMEKTMELAKARAFKDNPKLSQEEWEKGMEMQERFRWLAYPFILLFNAIIGLIIGLVLGLIMRREPAAY